MKKIALVAGVFAAVAAQAEFEIDRSSMSEAYWNIWNDAEQAKIDADIEANRKADAVFAVDAPDGSVVRVEQLDHEFKFGAHIFNFNQLGKKEYNDAYKASYGEGGIFNSATVAFYWRQYEPEAGHLRAFADYEDTERYWNSLTREEALAHPYWRRPCPGPAIDFCRQRRIRVHGHILVWGLLNPSWIYDCYCPEKEKRVCEGLGVPRRDEVAGASGGWVSAYDAAWQGGWRAAYPLTDEKTLASEIPAFTAAQRRIFRKRVFDVAKDYGALVDSWDVVNESAVDWAHYRKSRTGLPLWFSRKYGLMPGDYPLHALLDAKEAMPATAKLNINDYRIDDDFLAQVKDLADEGCKIDIVGCQMHIMSTNACLRLAQGATNVNWVGTPATIEARLDMMSKAGRPIHISEITITSPGADARSRMIQAVLTYNIYRKWFSHRNLMGITWWNTVDGAGAAGEPLVSGLFTADMKKKPAYEALDRLINHEWKTRTAVPAKGGKVRFRGFRGRYRLVWQTADGAVRMRDAYLTGAGGQDEDANAGKGLPYRVAQPPTDGRVAVPKMRFYSTVAKARAKALTEAEAEKEVPFPPRFVTHGADGMIDLRANSDYVSAPGADGNVSGYLVFRVKSPDSRVTFFYEKNDWYGALAINGKTIADLNGDTKEWTVVPIGLKEGWNEFVFRTSPGSSGAWSAALALRDPDGELQFEE